MLDFQRFFTEHCSSSEQKVLLIFKGLFARRTMMRTRKKRLKAAFPREEIGRVSRVLKDKQCRENPLSTARLRGL
jgi:hypothetical protein